MVTIIYVLMLLAMAAVAYFGVGVLFAWVYLPHRLKTQERAYAGWRDALLGTADLATFLASKELYEGKLEPHLAPPAAFLHLRNQAELECGLAETYMWVKRDIAWWPIRLPIVLIRHVLWDMLEWVALRVTQLLNVIGDILNWIGRVVKRVLVAVWARLARVSEYVYQRMRKVYGAIVAAANKEALADKALTKGGSTDEKQ